ncbi:MAG: sulfatase-like hydrolase/transferase [Sphingomonadaceae bacterium]|nr:sulfatase-like hydrolase/transferase [Sphingomonadaceae bacterium]
MHKPGLLSFLIGASFALSSPAMGQQIGPDPKPRPNVVVILADDAGYADFGFQGSREFRTPNIDALAREGVVFSAAYATTPFCSPSRAGLLTGRYPQRFGYEFNLTHAPPPGVDPQFMGLAREERTLGDHFRTAGYRTIAVGKWHVGSLPQYHPNARGFDDFYGFLGGGSTYFAERVKPGTIERNGQPAKPSEYLTDDFARKASAYITANRDRPFLLYLAFNAVHTPMDARPEDLKQVAHIADPQRRRLAAMTLGLDRAVGSVRATLRELKLDRNTLIVFTNDNGGDRVGLDASNAPLRGTKGTLLEGGVRVPLIVRYPDRHGAGTRRADPVSLMDILPTALAVSKLPAPTNLDGRSLLDPPPTGGERALFWRYDNMAAMREGRWKLLRYPDRPAELYDLEADIGEARDLAMAEPERLRAMMARLFAWEGTLTHPRWNTGTFWSQEDVRRYSEAYVAAAIAREKAALAKDAGQ